MSTDPDTWGPALRALTEKQRAFVLAMAADPFGNATKWARAAGYSDKSMGAKVKGHYLIHDPRIEAAVMEVAKSALHTVGPMLATAVMLRAAANPKHPKQLRAAEMLANRVGMHETSEHVVNVNHTDQTGAAMVDRIKELAVALGVDAAQLLGANAAPALALPKVIEGELIDGHVSGRDD